MIRKIEKGIPLTNRSKNEELYDFINNDMVVGDSAIISQRERYALASAVDRPGVIKSKLRFSRISEDSFRVWKLGEK